MSGNQPSPENTRLSRPRTRWKDAQASCGDLVTILPGQKHVWMSVGPAAEAWRQINPQLRHLMTERGFTDPANGFQVYMYMIGESKDEATPRIIVCSDDIKPRQTLRKAIRDSGILKGYPGVGLAESSLSSLGFRRSRDQRAISLHVPGHSETPQRRPDHAEDEIRPSGLSSAQETIPSLLPNRSTSPASSRPGSRPGTSGTTTALSLRFSRISALTASSTPTASSNVSMCDACSRSLTSEAPAYDSANTTPRTSTDQLATEAQDSADATVTPTLKGIACDPGALHGPNPVDDGESDLDLGLNLESEDDDMRDSSECENLSDLESEDGRISTLEEDDPLIPLLNQTVPELLSAFDSYRSVPQGHKSQSCKPPAEQGQSISQQPAPSQPRKSKRPPEDDAPGEGEKTGPKKQRTKQERGRVFACPFWKKNRYRHAKCFMKDMSEVRRVKQHLRRVHKPIRCPRCQLEFEAADKRDEHFQEEVGCDRNPAFPDEVSEAQDKELNKKPKAGLTREDQWYLVWEIIFPNEPRPPSPYLEADLSAEICDFRDFFASQAHGVVLGHLRASHQWTDDDEARFASEQGPLNHALMMGLQTISERFLANRQAQSNLEPGSVDPQPAAPRPASPEYFPGLQNETPSPGPAEHSFEDASIPPLPPQPESVVDESPWDHIPAEQFDAWDFYGFNAQQDQGDGGQPGETPPFPPYPNP